MRFDDFELKQHISGGGVALGDGCMLVENVNGKRSYSVANSSGVWRSLYVDVPDTAIEAAAAAMGMVWPDTVPTPPDPVVPVDPPVVPPIVGGWDEYSPALQQLVAVQPDMVPLAGPQFAPPYTQTGSEVIVSGNLSAYYPLLDNTTYLSDGTAFVANGLGSALNGRTGTALVGIEVRHTDSGASFSHTNISNAKDCGILQCNFVGALAADGYGVGTLLRVTSCDGLLITGNVFRNGGVKAIVFSHGAQNIDFGYNEIVDTRIDAIQMSGCDYVNIHHNWLHRWKRDPNDNTHPDAIQSMVIETLDRAQLVGVSITDNIIDIEDFAYTQSLFNRNEKGIANSHQQWVIADNLIINAHHHGITAVGSDTQVADNVVIKHANQSDPFNARKFAEFGGYSNSVFQPKINGAGVRSGNRVFASLADALTDSNHFYRD